MWTDLIRFAEELINSDPQNNRKEAIYRSVINRCYYGSFIYTRNKYGYQKVSSSVHKQVIDHCLNRSNKTERKLGRQLEELFEYRKSADYKNKWDKRKPLNEAALKAISWARSIEGILNNLDK